MSYTVAGVFVRDKKLVAEAFLDELKSLGDQRYSAAMEKVDPVDAPSDIKHFEIKKDSFSFLGYVEKETEDAEKVKAICCNCAYDSDNYDFVSDNEEIKKIHLLDCKDEEDKKEYYSVGFLSNRVLQGDWYDIDSFKNAKKEYEDELAKSKEELDKKNAIKNSIDYYKLDEDQKSELCSDIACDEEDYEDMEWKKEVCGYMISVLHFYEEGYFTEGDYKSKKVYVFIYAE